MKIVMTFRLTPDLVRHLREASARPMSPSMTRIVERGIALALHELHVEGGKRALVKRKK